MADYVFLYAPPWAGPTRFSKHHLAHHFASRGDRVLWVEAPLTPLAVKRGRQFVHELRATMQAPHLAEANLWVRRHFLPVPYHAITALTSRRSANRLGQRLLAPVVRRDLARLRMPRPILLAGLPHAADLVPLLPRRAVIYHCADDYAAVRGFPLSLPDADMCALANLVITTSETLCHSRRQWNPNTHWVPNGADVEHFSRRTTPARDMERLPRPRVGFIGGLSEWVDFALLRELATRHPEWSFVLIGPPGAHAETVRRLSNVHLLGARDYATLPSYLAAFDVALIPFKRDKVTYHADPIKAYEYLAAGVPVVATDLPALRRLSHVLALADSVDGFERAIGDALALGREPGRAGRLAEAQRHSWTARFAQIDALIADVACAS